jgi:protein-L-isoaspartate(D-aspartate) O-methyltransferase
MAELSAFRRFYAMLIAAKSNVSDMRIVDAFANAPREAFVGPGPWQVWVEGKYIPTPSDDAAFLYQDILIALDTDKGINNGEPSLHVRCLEAAGVQPGEQVLHIGCGTGYYTSILAELVGPRGHVCAIDIEPKVASRAAENLKGHANVRVECRSGSEGPLPVSDIIYVNAGATEPLRIWLDALSDRGRLIFPLTPGRGYGGMLLVTRRSTSRLYDARCISSAAFIPCVGGQDDDVIESLAVAFREKDSDAIKSLRIGEPQASQPCWYKGNGWWLSSEAASA